MHMSKKKVAYEGKKWGKKLRFFKAFFTFFHLWFHKLLYEPGYCSDLAPKTITQTSSQGKIYYSIKFRTWSFSS